ncbi:hypothetical protein BP6252_07308 [Coleophoma cylindrospora]|uniref:Major facilitator superfamily (MFS) profile domain-containing protein n=1 Tax=Coleophoma cylindrospora TaxID=1849047 RepID=A0A3D8RHT0_9HELO|nr:hypothetical protein BP6252_07308 [Coleophoma cylindrospora]
MSPGGEQRSQQSQHNDFAIRPLALTSEILFNIVMCSAQGTVQGALAQGIIPGLAIGKSFGATASDLAWFPAAYALTTGL